MPTNAWLLDSHLCFFVNISTADYRKHQQQVCDETVMCWAPKRMPVKNGMFHSMDVILDGWLSKQHSWSIWISREITQTSWNYTARHLQKHTWQNCATSHALTDLLPIWVRGNWTRVDRVSDGQANCAWAGKRKPRTLLVSSCNVTLILKHTVDQL